MLDKKQFDRVYEKRVLENSFFEEDIYYSRYKSRYFNTLRWLHKAKPESGGRVLEVGGGHIALLMDAIDGWQTEVVDISTNWAESVEHFGIPFHCCNLLDESLESLGMYDLIVLCEVIEHLPVPPYVALEKISKRLKPGGVLFVTTPNLSRLRNILYLILGREIFCNWFFPDKSASLGHVTEFSRSHLQFQLTKAGLQQVEAVQTTLTLGASSVIAKIGRILLQPFSIAPHLRENLVAWGVR